MTEQIFNEENPIEDSRRKLATVTHIKSIIPIEGADFIELITFTSNNWQCIAGRGEFKIGDACTFFEIDSFLPQEERYSVLEGRCNKVLNGRNGYRIKTLKVMKGTAISQGFAMPLTAFPELAQNAEDGTDVTEALNVKLWTTPTLGGFGFHIGKCLRGFPTHIVSKTDQERLQAMGKRQIIDMFGYDFELSEKCDGTSATYYCFGDMTEATELGCPDKTYENYQFGVCSRNLELKEPGAETLTINLWDKHDDEGNVVDTLSDEKYQGNPQEGYTRRTIQKSTIGQSVYWDMASKYHIRERLEAYCKENNRLLAIQGEICGPGIQKNPLGLHDIQLFVFDIYDTEKQRYVAAPERKRIIADLNTLYDDNPIRMVPVVAEGFSIAPKSQAIKLAAELISDDTENAWPVFFDKLTDVVVHELIRLADGDSLLGHGKAREGLVFKASHYNGNELSGCPKSFKVISNRYLLKNDL